MGRVASSAERLPPRLGLHRDDVPEDAAIDGPLDVPTEELTFDRDRDGVNDDVDTCLATIEDNSADDDTDMLTNAADPCPFNTTPNTNADGDDLPDACDPFTSIAGDHHLCVMTFQDTVLANALWATRSGSDIGWAANPGQLIAIPVGFQTGTAMAALSLEGANVTTYQGLFTFRSHGKAGGITMWLRADPAAPAASDVGCHIEAMLGSTMATVGVTTKVGFRDQKPVTFTPGMDTSLRIQGSLATVGSDVLATCRFTVNSLPVLTSTATVPLVPGHFGVTTDRWDVSLDGLYITDRP